MGVLSNKISRDALKPGDHIYSWRNAYLYSHHGIYAGEGKVIHFTRGAGQEVGTGTVLDKVIFSSSASSDRTRSPCTVCGDQSSLSGVISSCIDCFIWDGDLYLFEYEVSWAFFLAKARGGTCTRARSDPPEDVLHRASFLLENGFGGYDVFKNNCEDFAIYCKTGLLIVTDISVGRSGQATTFVAAIGAVVSFPLSFLRTSIPVLAAVNCGSYCISRLVSDIGVRRDVMKVPVERLVKRCGWLDELPCGVVDQCGGEDKKAGTSVDQCGGEDKKAGTSVDQCGSEDKKAGTSVDQCGGQDKKAGASVDQCGGEDKKAGTSVDQCGGQDKKAGTSVDQCCSEDKKAGTSVDQCGGQDKKAGTSVDQVGEDKTDETVGSKED